MVESVYRAVSGRDRGSNVGSIAGSEAGAARLGELAGGDISVESEDGPGTTFLVRLPLSSLETST